jgi:hypothetical protein
LYKTYLFKFIYYDLTDAKEFKKIETIYDKLNKIDDKSKIKKMSDIIEKLFYKIEDTITFFDISIILINKFTKNKNILDKCGNKFIAEEFKDKVSDQPDKFVSWFIS